MTKETAIEAIKDFVKLHDNFLAVRVVPAEVLDILIEAIKTVLPLIEDDPSHPFADDVLMEVEQC